MQTRFLFLINGILAICLGIFVNSMLPYARSLGCDVPVSQGFACNPIDSAELVFSSLALPTLIIAVSYLAVRIKTTHSRASLLLLLLFPITVAIWVSFILLTAPF